MSKLYSCAITSQRPTRFKFKYQEYMTSCKRLKKRLHDVFAELYRRGVRRFYVGGALGVDLWAGEILLEMRRQEEYQGLEIVLVYPFPGHDERWDPEESGASAPSEGKLRPVCNGQQDRGGPGVSGAHCLHGRTR